MEPIKFSDYPKLKKFFRHQKYPLCVYSLSSIIAWTNSFYTPYGTVQKESLIILSEFEEPYKDKRHLILPISPEREFSPKELYEIAQTYQCDRYFFVPKDYLERFGKEDIELFFKITEQPDLNDYIYLSKDLADLKGNKYSKKRNLINQFKRSHVNKGGVRIEPITPSVVTECIDFLDEWCEERHCDEDEKGSLACEKQAAINALEHLELLEMQGILLRIDNKVSAFGMGSRLTDEMGCFHFEKAFADIKGLYQYFDRECARHLFKGYKYINKESDMNIPELAKAKKSYLPVMIAKSYQLGAKKCEGEAVARFSK
jgi:hypothetical protein